MWPWRRKSAKCLPQRRTQGYATEAVRAMLAWGATAFGKVRAVRCLIEEGHWASRNVALKCGFTDFALVEHQSSPAWLLELQPPVDR